MKIQELISRLNNFNPDQEIMILDSFNGAGCPREINLGPRIYNITESDAEETADCEDFIGKEVVVIGYGCY